MSTATETKVTHHAKYFSPGSLFSEESTVELSARDVEEAQRRAPKHAFAFVIYDRPVIDFDYDEERFRVIPKPQDTTCRYYLGGTLHTLDAVRAMGESHRILAANMDGNGWAQVVHTRLGNWQPFEEGDTLLEPLPEQSCPAAHDSEEDSR